MEELYTAKEDIQKRLNIRHDSQLVDTVMWEMKFAVDNAVKKIVEYLESNTETFMGIPYINYDAMQSLKELLK